MVNDVRRDAFNILITQVLKVGSRCGEFDLSLLSGYTLLSKLHAVNKELSALCRKKGEYTAFGGSEQAVVARTVLPGSSLPPRFWAPVLLGRVERRALTRFYTSTGGPNWLRKSEGWLGPHCLSRWRCVALWHDRVYKLCPDDAGLSGRLPAEIGDLRKLQILNLYRNRLTGPIPNEIGDLHKLQILNLYRNRLTGPIPKEIGNLIMLTELGLNNNRFTG